MGRVCSVFLLLYVFGCVKTILNFNTVMIFQLICYVTMMITLILLWWSIFRFCISVWTCVCMSLWVNECECVSKIENRISIILLIYYNLLRLWMQICCVCRSLLSRCLFFCLQFSVSLLFCVVNCWANSSGVYMLYSFDIVCELQSCVCAVPTYLYCKERKVMHTQWIFIVEKSSQCEIVCGSVVVLCVGAVKGIMTAAAAVAYAHVSLYSYA